MREQANTGLLALIAVLLVILVLRPTAESPDIESPLRDIDGRLGELEVHLSEIRGWVCLANQRDEATPQDLFRECWSHEVPNVIDGGGVNKRSSDRAPCGWRDVTRT
ncbi:MAG: hypothetical protein ACREX3_04205 [Gammaproteobacteria bacterium]